MTVHIRSIGFLCIIGAITGVSEAQLSPPKNASVSAISAPQFAMSDLDGDGQQELVVGGRVGPFKAITDAPVTKNARVEVYTLNGDNMELKAISDELHIVNDVTIADLDGDGSMEIVAIGDFRILILRFDGEKLLLENAQTVSKGRYRHVRSTDIDGDGRSELIVSEVLRGKSEEIPQTEIHFLSFDGVWRELNSLHIDRHVGDLCLDDFDGDGKVELVLEQGAEEIGGYLSVFELNNGSVRERFAQQVTQDNTRVLRLAVARGTSQAKMLGILKHNGELSLWRMSSKGFLLAPQVSLKMKAVCVNCPWPFWEQRVGCK